MVEKPPTSAGRFGSNGDGTHDLAGVADVTGDGKGGIGTNW
ncbi:hypothetical protein [Streptomyces sp. ISL-43]|nr:hypothetical protein [Streptomyces sp. ISL-43]